MKPTNTTTLHSRKSIGRSPLRLSFLLIPLLLAWFALPQTALAADGGLPGANTAEGTNALFSLTTGIDNTAIGFDALFSTQTGSRNTANGAFTLFSNRTGRDNTANGRSALQSNTTGSDNTATGAAALFSNTTGNLNTATGFNALIINTTGGRNTATGFQALNSNTSGSSNTANGFEALFSNTTGSANIALGVGAGGALTTGSNNIDIGNTGVAGEANKIRIGTVGTHNAAFIAGISGSAITGTPVVVNANGRLGVASSSQRFKDEIKPMEKTSEAVLALRPVTFRYKLEVDPERASQFGLVAEEVEKVNPDLVARDADGKIYTVRYEAVNAMLLNEFLKEHRKVEQQEATIAQLKQDFRATVAELTARLREQDSKIQKVSDQLELGKPAPQVVDNNQ